MSDRNELGHFQKGNKLATGRPLGAKNQLTNIMAAMHEQGYTAGQALVQIASDTADEFSPELKAKADAKLLDAVVKLAPSEPVEAAETMTETQLDQRLTELLSVALCDDSFVIVPKSEWQRLNSTFTV